MVLDNLVRNNKFVCTDTFSIGEENGGQQTNEQTIRRRTEQSYHQRRLSHRRI